MKKILIAIIVIAIFIYVYSFVSRCGILPQDTNYEIVLGNCLYKLTKNGFIEMGCIEPNVLNMLSDIDNILLSKSQKMIYLFDIDYNSDATHKVVGIYKIDLYKLTTKPTLVIETGHWVRTISVSPNGNFLLFAEDEHEPDLAQYNIISLLDLKTEKHQRLTDDYNSLYDAAWINDHQFIYSSTKINETSKKHILYLYDINTNTKVDMHLDGYYPGVLSPNGKELVLTSDKKTVLYNIFDGSIKVLANKKMQITSMIWLPDAKGFLYTDITFEEFLDAFIFVDAHYGLYYYSLEKNRSVRLRKYYDLTSRGGFVVPPGLAISVPYAYSELNKKPLRNPKLIKICKFI